MDQTGKALRPSFLIGHMQRLFSGLAPERPEMDGKLSQVQSLRDGREYLAAGLREFADGLLDKEQELSLIHILRNVAVTEGDKVEAQMRFGWEIDAYPVNEIADYVNDVKQGDIDALVEEYYDKYDIIDEGRDVEEFRRHVAVQAGIEIGFERFLQEKDYQAIVTHCRCV